MPNDVILETYLLKTMLDNHPVITTLNQLEKAMDEDKTVQHLSSAFQRIQAQYNETLHYFPSQSDEAEKVQRALFEAKQKLDLHPLVHQYYQIYREVRVIYQSIQDALFTPFTSHVCGGDF